MVSGFCRNITDTAVTTNSGRAVTSMRKFTNQLPSPTTTANKHKSQVEVETDRKYLWTRAWKEANQQQHGTVTYIHTTMHTTNLHGDATV
eukprot:gene7039-411_t